MRTATALILGLVLGAAGVAAVAEDKPGTVTARSLALVDAAGTVKARLYVDDGGFVRVEGFDLPVVADPKLAGKASALMLRVADMIRDRATLDELTPEELATFQREAGWTATDTKRANQVPELLASWKQGTDAGMSMNTEWKRTADHALRLCERALREGRGKDAARALDPLFGERK